MITIFVSSRDTQFTKQKRYAGYDRYQIQMQWLRRSTQLHRGATMIHDAEGTYNHERKAVLITVITVQTTILNRGNKLIRQPLSQRMSIFWTIVEVEN